MKRMVVFAKALIGTASALSLNFCKAADTGEEARHLDVGTEPPRASSAPGPIEVNLPAPLPNMRARSAAPSRSVEAPAASSLASLEQVSEGPASRERPVVTFAAPRVKGGLLTDIEAPVRRLRAGIRACYARFLDEEDEAPARSSLSLHLVVLKSGSVRSATAEEVTGLGASAVDCMVRRAEMATLPPAAGEPAEVVLPLSFLP
jgi:hypothetical protein